MGPRGPIFYFTRLNSIVTDSTATVTTATVSQTALLQLAIATYAGIKSLFRQQAQDKDI